MPPRHKDTKDKFIKISSVPYGTKRDRKGRQYHIFDTIIKTVSYLNLFSLKRSVQGKHLLSVQRSDGVFLLEID